MSTSSSAEPGARPCRVALLGSTGSIGRQALDVLARDERFQVVALAAGSNSALLGEQVRRFAPRAAVLADPDAAGGLGEIPAATDLEVGAGGLTTLAARDDVDIVVVGTGGMASLRAVVAALEAGTVVATANKETLVAGGHLVMPLARGLAARAPGAGSASRPETAAGPEVSPATLDRSPLAWLRPIDSEHSAIWQCLVGEAPASIARLILTASGGPFLDADPERLAGVSAADALRHPTWRMGPKITIDSATLANKGLEVIEAHWLYDVPYEAIDVVIHPQSLVHSAVQFVDGSLKAQLGTPDMRLPIQYALTYPDRRPSPAAPPDLVGAGRLEFRMPDEDRFPALRIARQAGREGPWASAALIAADEVAVARFLQGSIGFADIPRLLGAAVDRFAARPGAPDLEALVALEPEIRERYGVGSWP